MSDTRAAMRAASLVVLGSALVGVLAGVLWAWWAPSGEQVAADGQLAVISDAWLGAIGLGCGAVVGLVASSRVRRHPFALIGGLLAGWLETDPWPPWFDRMILMFQREVAERIVATPAQRVDYGRLGVLAGWRAQSRILFDVPPSAFSPPPKVTSSVVELIPREKPLPCNGKILTAVTASAFNQRRKMLRQSLKGLAVNGRTLDALDLLKAAGIEETKRAEEVDVAGFATLARIAEEMGGA